MRLPDGTEVVVTRRASQPESDSFELEMTVPSGGASTPPHVHPAQTDEFEVVEGSLEVLFGEEWRMLRAGESLVVPAGVVHTFRNESGRTAKVRNVHDPAQSFQRYIERFGALADRGDLRNMRSPKALMLLAMLFEEHQDVMRFSKPVHRGAFSVLARLGRRRGLRLP